MPTSEKGFLFELFTSVQGEGLWTGCVQHFVRLAGCHVECAYCDTIDARKRVACFESPWPDQGEINNPVGVSQALDLVRALEQATPKAQALAVTGGEPLEQVEFLSLFLPCVKREIFKDRPVLLETAGLHADAMQRLVNDVDMVSMDIKLASVSGLKDTAARHKDFLEVLRKGGFYVKTVVNSETPLSEVLEAARLIAEKDAAANLFLQPETRQGKPVTGEYLIRCWETAREYVENVRIQPQLHRLLDIR
ncbi:MAG: 7-carboxy-7-deazaguanine synthase QueE [Planctomycetota bacterium]